MEDPARYGFPTLALALVATLAGCKTEPPRQDVPKTSARRQSYSECMDLSMFGAAFDASSTHAIEKQITEFRPGRTTLAEVEQVLGTLMVEPNLLMGVRGTIGRKWKVSGRTWDFGFSGDGVLEGFGRVPWSFHIAFDDAKSADNFDRWYSERLGFNPVPPQCAQDFKPSVTTQEHVIAAWGACAGAKRLDTGGFTMRWGSLEDGWTLEFDTSGVLVAEPRHCQIPLGG